MPGERDMCLYPTPPKALQAQQWSVWLQQDCLALRTIFCMFLIMLKSQGTKKSYTSTDVIFVKVSDSEIWRQF